MKKLFIASLCLLLAGLCACEPSRQEKPTSSGESTETATTAIALSTVDVKADENDPFSFVVKELYDDVRSHSIDMNYDFLKGQFYTFYDIDGNGTEELLLGVAMWEDGENTLHSICAIKDGIAMNPVPLWTDDDSPVVLFTNATIMTKRASDNERRISYYRFEDGELKYQTGLRYGDDYSLEYDDGEYYRRESGEYIPITKEEFNRVKQEMEGDGQVVELDWKPLAEYGQ